MVSGQFPDRHFPDGQLYEDISLMDSFPNDISPNGHFPESHISFQE